MDGRAAAQAVLVRGAWPASLADGPHTLWEEGSMEVLKSLEFGEKWPFSDQCRQSDIVGLLDDLTHLLQTWKVPLSG